MTYKDLQAALLSGSVDSMRSTAAPEHTVDVMRIEEANRAIDELQPEVNVVVNLEVRVFIDGDEVQTEQEVTT